MLISYCTYPISMLRYLYPQFIYLATPPPWDTLTALFRKPHWMDTMFLGRGKRGSLTQGMVLEGHQSEIEEGQKQMKKGKRGAIVELASKLDHLHLWKIICSDKKPKSLMSPLLSICVRYSQLKIHTHCRFLELHYRDQTWPLQSLILP